MNESSFTSLWLHTHCHNCGKMVRRGEGDWEGQYESGGDWWLCLECALKLHGEQCSLCGKRVKASDLTVLLDKESGKAMRLCPKCKEREGTFEAALAELERERKDPE
jgi:hypothetical protein